MLEVIRQPWPWYVAGPLISLIMFSMLFFGKQFGISSTMRTVCGMAGGSRFSSFFDFDWRSQMWNILFVIGAIIGGVISSAFLMPDYAIDLNPETIESLRNVGIVAPGKEYVPPIFNWENLMTFQGFTFMIIGGFMVGFGTRYAGGCTSGHAISGLSNLQIPSLIAVVGFFIGGLIVTHLIIPVLL